MKTKKILKKFGIGIGALLVVILGIFFVYTLDYYKADDSALQLVIKNSNQIDDNKNMIVFHAKEEEQTKTAMIFYPGGKVETSAYAPLLSQIADRGITCILAKMPFHLAVFDVNAADEIIEQFDSIDTWYIGGHSLGGAMASNYAASHEENIDGLILLGAYPTKPLSIPIIAFYGSEDKVLNREKLETVTDKIKIEGGNHAYYGNYGEQKGDGVATITREEQQTFTVTSILEFIDQLEAGK